jgi:hypothetical protein
VGRRHGRARAHHPRNFDSYRMLQLRNAEWTSTWCRVGRSPVGSASWACRRSPRPSRTHSTP